MPRAACRTVRRAASNAEVARALREMALFLERMRGTRRPSRGARSRIETMTWSATEVIHEEAGRIRTARSLAPAFDKKRTR